MPRRSVLWCAVFGVFGVLSSGLADLLLVEDGEARGQVVIADAAPREVRDAAADFVRVVKRMTGAELPLVVESGSDVSHPRVLVGACALPSGVGAAPSVIQGDGAYAGYVVVCTRNVLVLAGNTPTGTANAVYGFLQDQLGVRWFLPMELFEVMPSRRTVSVPEKARVVTPSFVCRYGWGSWQGENQPWARRNRVNDREGGYAVPHGAIIHSMYALFPPSVYGKMHPDIYPLLNGKRAIPERDGQQLAQPCTGNPETIRIAIERITAYFDAHPNAHTYPFSINDNNTWCECELCSTHDIERPENRGRRVYSDRWFAFVNAVAKGVREKHPTKFLGTIAYAGVEQTPLSIERIEPNVSVHLTQDTAQFFDPDYEKTDYDLIRAWQQKCGQVGRSNYYGLGALTPRCFPHLLAADLKAIHGMGIRAFHSEMYPYWANMGPMLYLAAQLLWDVTLDPDVLLDEFYRSTFGAAEAEMRAFYQVHEDAWLSQGTGKWFRGISKADEQMGFYTTAQVAAAEAHLRQAVAMADDETVRARVRYIAHGYAYPSLLLSAWTAARDARDAAIGSDADATALAAQLERLVGSLDEEQDAWQTSVMDDPIIDAWYKRGARPTIRGQWRASVREGLVEGLRTLSVWYRTGDGRKASDVRRRTVEKLTANPQVALLWQALQGTLRRGPNLLPNPGFEAGKAAQRGPAGPEWQTNAAAAGWSIWQQFQDEGRFYLDAATKRSGRSSGAFQGGTCLCYITTIPIVTGSTYLAEVWAMAPTMGENTKVTLDVRWHDAEGRWYTGAANHRVETQESGVWERLQIPFKAPEGASEAVVLLVGEGIEQEDVVRYDDAFAGEVSLSHSVDDDNH